MFRLLCPFKKNHYICSRKKELKQENDDYAFPHHSILHPQALRKRGRLLERQAAVLRIQRSINAAHWTLGL